MRLICDLMLATLNGLRTKDLWTIWRLCARAKEEITRWGQSGEITRAPHLVTDPCTLASSRVTIGSGGPSISQSGDLA
jgi:hypothetical protein